MSDKSLRYVLVFAIGKDSDQSQRFQWGPLFRILPRVAAFISGLSDVRLLGGCILTFDEMCIVSV
jgi:hypothetical protein